MEKTLKHQIVVIHGGDPRTTMPEYLAELKKTGVDADDFKDSKNWRKNLQAKLGDAYEVFTPEMPLAEFAAYDEWKIWFEKMVPFLRDGVMLIGHSLGAIFLTKYLSENKFPHEIRATIFVAPPFKPASEGEDFAGFAFGDDLSGIAAQSQETIIYHSEDDPIVPYSEGKKLEAAIEGSRLVTLHDRKHVWQEEFPELVADIKKLYA